MKPLHKLDERIGDSRMLRAGVAVANITPPVGLEFSGFWRSSQGIHDNLYAKALVLNDGKQVLAIVTTDLVGLDGKLVADIRRMIEDRSHIPESNIMIAASHTHSGPITINLRGQGRCDEAYVDILMKKIAGAVYEAQRNLKECKLGAGKGRARIGVNRRKKTPNGRVAMDKNPEGPVDPEVSVLRIDALNEGIYSILFNYACHPVLNRGPLISADYPGYAMRLIETYTGATAMFLQGCGGNVNPICFPSESPFEDAKRLGTILGAEVLKVAEQIETSEEVDLRTARTFLDLPLRELPTVKEAEELVNKYVIEVEEKRERRGTSVVTKQAGARLDWAKEVLDLAREGKRSLTRKAEIQVMAFDDIAMVAISSEPMVEYALGIKRYPNFKFIFVVGYANGYFGYIPTARSIPEGGWEVDGAVAFSGALYPFGPEVEGMIRDAANKLLAMIKETM